MGRKRDRLLFAPRRKRHPGCLMNILLLFFVLALVFGLNHVNNGHATLLHQPVTVAGMASAYEGFPILHLSDLHAARFGEAQQRIRQLIRLENYRAVCLTGDMVGRSGDVQPLLDLLAQLPTDVPVFLIAGDDDPEAILSRHVGTGEVKADFIRQAEEAGAIYLDSPYKVVYEGRNVWFSPASLYTTDLRAAAFALAERRSELVAGGADTPDGAAALRAVEYQMDVLARADEARKEMKPDDCYILLSHVPLDATAVSGLHEGERLQRKAVNFPGTVSLILAGHWNNGQWRLPLVGPVYVPSGEVGLRGWLPGDREVSGLAMVYAVPEYISPGLGTSGAYPWWMPFRLFNRPQLTLIKLTARIT